MTTLVRGAIVVALVAMLGCAQKTEPPVGSIEVLGYGILDYEKGEAKSDKTSSVGAMRTDASGLRVIGQTARIPIRPGLNYGLAFRVVGVPAEEVPVRVVLRSSAPCVLKHSGETVYHNDSVLTVKVGQLLHIGGRFATSADDDHCVGPPQPGTYTFELYLGYRKLAEKTFHIYRE